MKKSYIHLQEPNQILRRVANLVELWLVPWWRLSQVNVALWRRFPMQLCVNANEISDIGHEYR